MARAQPPSQELAHRHPRGVQQREIEAVVGDKLATARLGVRSVAADGEGALHTCARHGLAADHDPDFEHARRTFP
jgi:hypothetical protein